MVISPWPYVTSAIWGCVHEVPEIYLLQKLKIKATWLQYFIYIFMYHIYLMGLLFW